MAPLRVSMGPLTTVFTPPPTRSDVHISTDPPSSLHVLDPAVSCHAAPDCFPQPARRPWSAGLVDTNADPVPIDSPGFRCPHGYPTACSTIRGLHEDPPDPRSSSKLSDLIEPGGPGDTPVGCCPRGDGCAGGNGVPVCKSDPTAGGAVGGVAFGEERERPATVTLTESLVGPVTTQRVRLVHRGLNDAVRPTTTKRSNGRSSAATPTRAYAEDSKRETSSSPHKSFSSLSLAAKITIGIVTPIVILVIAVIGFLFFRRRWGFSNKKIASRQRRGTLDAGRKPESAGDPGKTCARGYQKEALSSNGRVFELHTANRAFEPHSDDRIHEIHSTRCEHTHHSSHCGPELCGTS